MLIAAPSTKSITCRVYFETSLSATLDQVVALLLDLDPAEAMRVEPVLEPVDVAVGVGLPAGPRPCSTVK